MGHLATAGPGSALAQSIAVANVTMVLRVGACQNQLDRVTREQQCDC